MSKTLERKVVVITGAAGGMGWTLTEALLADGAHVVAADVSEARLAGLVERLAKAGHAGQVLPLELDVSDSHACSACVEETVSTFGRLDALVNNAALGMGIVRLDHMSRPVGIEELEPETWDRVVRVNLSGAWYMTRYAFPLMRERGFGRIINVTTSFFTMLRGGFHPYGPAKAGLEAMAAGHAKEFAGTGVSVNVVVPGGPADTPMAPECSPFDRGDLIAPSAMVAPIRWLCAEADDDVTGQRFIAAAWDTGVPAAQAAAHCRAPIAWPDLAQTPVWPGGKPSA